LDRQFKYIVYYFMMSSILEILAKIFLKLDKPQEYFWLVNHFYVFIETILVGLFIYTKLHSEKIKKLNVFCCLIILIFQFWVFFTSPILNSEYSSALLATVFSVLLLFSLFDYSQHSYKKKFYQTPNILVLLSFLSAYLFLLILFWFLPTVISYSRVLANILIIIKNIVGIFFYIVIVYSVRLSALKNKFAR
jgi:hypothetical protein